MPQDDAPIQQAPKRSFAERWATAKTDKPQEPRSIGGFIGNLGQDALDILEGVAKTTLVTAPKSIYDFASHAKDWHYLWENPEIAAGKIKDTTKAVVNSVIEPYERMWNKGDYGALYEHPGNVALDALTLLSLGGGAVAKGARFAGGLSKLERAAQGVEAVSKASRLVDWGEAAVNAPGRWGQKILEAPMKLIGIDPAKRGILKGNWRDESTLGNVRKQAVSESVAPNLRPVLDKGMGNELFERGLMGSTPELDAANPLVATVRRQMIDFTQGVREKMLGPSGRGLLTEDEMIRALAKKKATYTGKSVKEEFDFIKATPPEYRPFYVPFGKELEGGALDVFRELLEPLEVTRPGKLGKVDFLERYKGGKTTFPIEKALGKTVNDFIDVESRLRFLDRLKQQGLIHPIAKGEQALDKVIPVSEAIFTKYFRDTAHAGSLGVKQIIDREGIAKAEQMLLHDPVAQKYIKAIAGIGASDPTVASYLKWTFYKAPEPFAKFIRLYDKILNAFKTSATVLNPHWYTGNIVGDAILSVMAGEYGLNYPLLSKRILGKLPPQFSTRFLPKNLGTGPSRWLRQADLASGADNLVRVGLWKKSVAESFKKTGASFAASEQTLDDFYKAVGASPEELSNLEVKNRLLMEHIARNSATLPGLDKEILTLEKALGKEQVAVQRAGRGTSATSAYREAAALKASYGEKARAYFAKRASLLEDLKNVDVIIQNKAKAAYTALNKNRVERLLIQDQLAELRSTAAKMREAARSGDTGKVLERFGKEYRQRFEGLRDRIRELDATKIRLERQIAKVGRVTRSELNQRIGDLKTAIGESLKQGRFYRDISKRELGGIASKSKTSDMAEAIRIKLQEKQALREGIIGETRQKLIESGEYARMIPEVQKYADVAQKGIELGNAFIGDYWGLGPIERGVFKRVVPFYAWTKAMGKLAFMYPFIAPKTAFFWHNYAKTLADMAGDSELPDWMAPYVPTHVYENGDTLWMKFKGLSPFGSVRGGSFGDTKIPAFLAFWEQNPFIRLGYRLVGGRDQFYWAGKPTDGSVVVNVGDGSVEKIENGKIVTVIPQAPLFKSIAYTFPVVQMLHQLVSDYDINRGPVLNPDGTIKYPKELWQRLVESVGPKTKIANKEALIRQEKMAEIHVLKDLKKMYWRASPQEKEYIKKVFEERQAYGRYRTKAAR